MYLPVLLIGVVESVVMASGPSSHEAAQRLQRELFELMSNSSANDTEGLAAFPIDDDLFHWSATVVGPLGTYYEGITFRLSLTFAHDYPYTPPEVRFITPCYHPNVSLHGGAICLDILRERWSAVFTVSSLLISIQSLLMSPNRESPLNVAAAEVWDDARRMRAEVLHHAGGTPRT